MATGIVSVAAQLLVMPVVARALLVVNAVAYAVLWILTLARAALHPHAVARDFVSHARAPGFFTVVAGTCVLGVQLVVVRPWPAAAAALWVFAAGLYVALIYTIFFVLIVRREKPALTRALGGGWLIAIVATEAVSILGAHVHASFPVAGRAILFAALCLWLLGGILYVWIMGFIFHRMLFLPMEPADMQPTHWVDAGAVAISTLAGVTLMENAALDPLLGRLAPLLEGLTLLFWVTATWWIPMLVLFGLWRHGLRRVPLRYEVELWSLVFPLGMYTVCSFELAAAIEMPALHAIAGVFVYAALGAWTATFAGLIRTLLGRRA
ncbi:MAG: tellurite resistance/C4-dicarboxylate transporter family protein [Deltaproteobacteria bacterium]|nr:tellurite resistance/C4-dicarboxylate transporter family protein [Deltaproteobacteria bacterium]